ncbi:hypothetical protein PoB_005183700 [Plakobranchus ocellatus]|uniref:Uncharacterized protein n=1 Tax=Plakobranchus ocellatus TaxID=259542 RepID=A0AAV4C162_9GAST|nr:hypothetical protein PoB_005183700 [Plakobranchus ocellatus]
MVSPHRSHYDQLSVTHCVSLGPQQHKGVSLRQATVTQRHLVWPGHSSTTVILLSADHSSTKAFLYTRPQQHNGISFGQATAAQR